MVKIEPMTWPARIAAYTIIASYPFLPSIATSIQEKLSSSKKTDTTKQTQHKKTIQKSQPKKSQLEKTIENETKKAEPKIKENTPKTKSERKDYEPLPLDDFTLLMTNEEFTDFNYLTQDEIQSYLESIDSCLKDKINDTLFSKKVTDLSQEYNINPLLLLARAQVEKSIVKKSDVDEKELEEMMGYGIPDNGSRKHTPKGYAAQLENCARRLRELYEEGENFDKLPTLDVNYGKEKLTPDNAATYALMRYTPHTVDTKLSQKGGGNYLLRLVYDSFKKEIDSLRK